MTASVVVEGTVALLGSASEFEGEGEKREDQRLTKGAGHVSAHSLGRTSSTLRPKRLKSKGKKREKKAF